MRSPPPADKWFRFLRIFCFGLAEIITVKPQKQVNVNSTGVGWQSPHGWLADGFYPNHYLEIFKNRCFLTFFGLVTFTRLLPKKSSGVRIQYEQRLFHREITLCKAVYV